MPNLLKVRVSLKGRPIRSYTFNKKNVSIGRDPASDIFLDNTGISRSHATIERTPGGYLLEDLGSANGTFLNDNQVQKDYLGHDDVVRIGKFALWVGVETDRRDDRKLLGNAPSPGAFEGTTVLSPDQLQGLQEKVKAEETAIGEPTRSERKRTFSIGAVLAAAVCSFLVGTAVGVGVALTILG